METTYLTVSLVLLSTFALQSISTARAQLTDMDRREVLDVHNHFRSIVAPTAANMVRLDWNDELATIAQNYADRCIFRHNDDRNNQQVQLKFSNVGENLAISSSPLSNYTALVESWHKERREYNYDANNCSGICGHYRQVVWASTTLIGCGAVRCSTTENFGIPNSLLLVCNYGSGSGPNSERPYESGRPCSSCSSVYTLCVDNTCTQSDQVITTTPPDPWPDVAYHINPLQLILMLALTLLSLQLQI